MKHIIKNSGSGMYQWYLNDDCGELTLNVIDPDGESWVVLEITDGGHIKFVDAVNKSSGLPVDSKGRLIEVNSDGEEYIREN
jgi:hypothetical protein